MQSLPKKPPPPTEVHESTKLFIAHFFNQGMDKQEVIEQVTKIPDDHYRKLVLKYVEEEFNP